MKILLTLILTMVFSMTDAIAQTLQVYAHRGMRSFAPENTLFAYKTTLRLGTDWVDMDTVMTKDDEVVLSHDPILSPNIVRDSNGKFLAQSSEALKKESPAEQKAYKRKYAIKNLTLKELQTFDVGRLNPNSHYATYFPDQVVVPGTHIPTLREVVRYVNKTTNKKVGFQIELKTDPTLPEYSTDPKKICRSRL